MGWAALIMGGSVLLSRFMGLIRDKVISYLFGATSESDLYFAAFVIPDFINYLLAGAYFSITLIPLLNAYFEKDEEDGWRFFSAVFTWIALLIFVLTALAMAFAPRLAHLAAPGLSEEALARLAFFLRIVLPAQICFLLGSCITAVLYLRKQFLIPALMPLIYNFMIILGGLLLRSRGMEGFCWGVLAGAFLGNFLLPYLGTRFGQGLRLRFCFYHPGLKRFFLLALPLMLGQSVVVLDEQLVRVFGSMAGIGAISWLNYARRIMLVPVGVVAQAAGVASYPFLAELAAKRDFPKFHQTLNSALRGALALLVPLSVWMMAVSEPTVRLIFQQGHFGPSDTLETSQVLLIMLAAVVCWGFQQVLGRGYYAQQDTLTPALIGTVATVFSVPVYYFVTRHFGVVGVALCQFDFRGRLHRGLEPLVAPSLRQRGFSRAGRRFPEGDRALPACGSACPACGQITVYRRRSPSLRGGSLCHRSQRHWFCRGFRDAVAVFYSGPYQARAAEGRSHRSVIAPLMPSGRR